MFNRNASSLILCRYFGYLSLLYLYTYTVKLPNVSPWRNECCCLTVVLFRLTRERERLSQMMVLLIKYTQVSHEHTEPMTYTYTHTPTCFQDAVRPPQIRHETEDSFRKEDATLWLPKPKGSAVSQTRKLNPFHVHFFPNTPSIHAEITYSSHYVSRKQILEFFFSCNTVSVSLWPQYFSFGLIFYIYIFVRITIEMCGLN